MSDEYMTRNECQSIREGRDKVDRVIGTITKLLIACAWGVTLMVATNALRYTSGLNTRVTRLEERTAKHAQKFTEISAQLHSLRIDIKESQRETSEYIKYEVDRLRDSLDTRDAE